MEDFERDLEPPEDLKDDDDDDGGDGDTLDTRKKTKLNFVSHMHKRELYSSCIRDWPKY